MRQKEIGDRIILEEMNKEERGKKGLPMKTLSFKKKDQEEEKHLGKSPHKKDTSGPSDNTRKKKGDKDQLMPGITQ